LKNIKVLILDYSVDRLETETIINCLPKDLDVNSLFIDTEESFPDNLIEEDYTHIIHTGSALSINEPAPFTKKVVKYIQELKDKGIWQMGICYGHQLVCSALVGKHSVRSSPNGFEVGWKDITFSDKSMRLLNIQKTEKIWQHHFDEVIELPKGSELLASNQHTDIQAYINYEMHLLGVQFHPEFNKEIGNNYFLKDRLLLEDNNFNVENIIAEGPSLDAGKVFFNFFLAQKK